MTRGIRGATTVTANHEQEILKNTKELFQDMVLNNRVEPEDVSHVFVSVTKDLNATFPAKALRELGEKWKYVPIMCMQEIEVPNSLERCIRIMMVVRTQKEQKEIQHVFHHDAVQLRPDLFKRR